MSQSLLTSGQFQQESYRNKWMDRGHESQSLLTSGQFQQLVCFLYWPSKRMGRNPFLLQVNSNQGGIDNELL